MSNYIEFKDTVAFHPGYYIKEIVDESGLTQEDFAKRLGTTPKNLSILIRGEQNLSIDIAMKLSRMMDTSVTYWLNLQNKYDSVVAEHNSELELIKERIVFKYFDYSFFRDNYYLPNIPRQTDEQIKALREFLNVSTLSVLTERDMSVVFRSSSPNMSVENIVRANAMVQIATNIALKEETTKYNKKKFVEAVQYALTLTDLHEEFYPVLRQKFKDAGVVFVILPNIPGSEINGATKKVGNSIMLMVSDRLLSADAFWFTLFHEIGHIMNGDFGISFDKEKGEQEHAADQYAEERLVPNDKYIKFLEEGKFDINSIRQFASEINRDPGIVLGRLQRDCKVDYDDVRLKSLRRKYKIVKRA